MAILARPFEADVGRRAPGTCEAPPGNNRARSTWQRRVSRAVRPGAR